MVVRGRGPRVAPSGIRPIAEREQTSSTGEQEHGNES